MKANLEIIKAPKPFSWFESENRGKTALQMLYNNAISNKSILLYYKYIEQLYHTASCQNIEIGKC